MHPESDTGDDTRSMRQRMEAGDPYLADDPELAVMAQRAVELMCRYNHEAGDHDAVLRELVGAVGDGTVVKAPFYVDYGVYITIGSRSFANYGLVALDVALITIGDDVQMGPNVQLLTPTHPVEPGPRRDKWEAASPIVVADNVWLGGGVIVLAGVTIGENSVIGAGAVVTRDVPANVVAVGNPARVIRSI